MRISCPSTRSIGRGRTACAALADQASQAGRGNSAQPLAHGDGRVLCGRPDADRVTVGAGSRRVEATGNGKSHHACTSCRHGHAGRRLLFARHHRRLRRLDRRHDHRLRHGIFTNILIGVAGSWIGSELAALGHIAVRHSLGHFVAALIGSVVLLLVFQVDPGPAAGLIGARTRRLWRGAMHDCRNRPSQRRSPRGAPAPSGKGASAGPAGRAQAGLDPGQGAGLAQDSRKRNKIVREHKLATVCEEARCPNIGECWEKKHATFMIMGETCTRACAFCNVRTGLPDALDEGEPARVADAVAKLGLSHVVVTSVDRDDLADGGAEHFARTIRAIRAASPGDDDRSADARFPAQGRRAGNRGRRQAGRLQPQSRDRAVEISQRAARRALFPFAAPAAAGQGARSDDVHQVGDHGRASARSATRCCR